jgi:hypothetical protein
MDFLTALPIIGPVVNKALGVVDQLVEDKDKANEIKAAVMREMASQDHEISLAMAKAQSDIIQAEIRGESWLQRAWRPILMLLVILIVANNYIVYPYLSPFTDLVVPLELPDQLWDLMQIGVGGFVVGRSAEKGIRSWKASR